jgi:hypothetical protein
MKLGNRYKAICLFLLTGGILVLHCKKEVVKPDPLDQKLIGSWMSTQVYTVGSDRPSPYSSISVTFNDDYTGNLDQELTEPDTVVSSPFAWRVAGYSLYLRFGGAPDEMEVPIEYSADLFKMTLTNTYQWYDEATRQIKSIALKTKITFRRMAG